MTSAATAAGVALAMPELDVSIVAISTRPPCGAATAARRPPGGCDLRFHDLRHSFGSLVIRQFDPVAVKAFMGHSKITTTERYLHERSRRTDAARLTCAFSGEPDALDDRAAVAGA